MRSTGLPSTATMMSPASTPASFAGLSSGGLKPPTMTPAIVFSPAACASSGEMSLIAMPSTGRRTLPKRTMSSITLLASVIGMAKPYPV